MPAREYRSQYAIQFSNNRPYIQVYKQPPQFVGTYKNWRNQQHEFSYYTRTGAVRTFTVSGAWPHYASGRILDDGTLNNFSFSFNPQTTTPEMITGLFRLHILNTEGDDVDIEFDNPDICTSITPIFETFRNLDLYMQSRTITMLLRRLPNSDINFEITSNHADDVFALLVRKIGDTDTNGAEDYGGVVNAPETSRNISGIPPGTVNMITFGKFGNDNPTDLYQRQIGYEETDTPPPITEPPEEPEEPEPETLPTISIVGSHWNAGNFTLNWSANPRLEITRLEYVRVYRRYSTQSQPILVEEGASILQRPFYTLEVADDTTSYIHFAIKYRDNPEIKSNTIVQRIQNGELINQDELVFENLLKKSQIEILKISENTIKLSVISELLIGNRITHIKASALSDNSNAESEIENTTEFNHNEITLEGLNPNTKYEVIVYFTHLDLDIEIARFHASTLKVLPANPTPDNVKEVVFDEVLIENISEEQIDNFLLLPLETKEEMVKEIIGARATAEIATGSKDVNPNNIGKRPSNLQRYDNTAQNEIDAAQEILARRVEQIPTPDEDDNRDYVV